MDRKVEDRTMLSRNDGVAAFPTITSLSESSFVPEFCGLRPMTAI